MSILDEGLLAEVQARFGNNPLYIKNSEIKDGIKKYVLYTLTGSSVNNTDINRRYSDFFALRKKLCERWPGIYIPNIPKKKAVGNLEIKTILSRTKLLNLFSERLAKYDYLLSSEEFNLFLSDQPNIAKQLEKMPSLKYEELCEKYKQAFPELTVVESYDDEFHKEKVFDFMAYLRKAALNIKHFKDMVSLALESKNKEFEHYVSFLESFDDYEKYGLLEYADNDEKKLVFFNPNNPELLERINKTKEKFTNPFEDIIEWLSGEEIDIEAMIDAVHGYENLIELRRKTEDKYQSLERGLRELQIIDKKSWKEVVQRKSKNEVIEEKQAEIKHNREESELLKKIIKYVTFHLNTVITCAKKEKLKEYYQHLKKFVTVQKENDKNIKDLWELIAHDKNILEEKQKGKEN